jgi:hypothetical protein
MTEFRQFGRTYPVCIETASGLYADSRTRIPKNKNGKMYAVVKLEAVIMSQV